MASPATYGSLPFAEQIAFLQRKVPSVDYAQVRQSAHDHAFVIAGGQRLDMVRDIHAVLNRNLREGDTLERFRQDFYAVLDNYGWQPEGGRAWRSRVIYETNLRTSYAAGRYAQLQAVKAERPFWLYQHSDAVITPRPEHLAWDGLVIAADDPWWHTHFPPNGWGCQCGVRALNQRDLQRMGKSGPDEAPPSNERPMQYRGETVQVPEGIDPGWDYAPGRSALEQQVQQVLEKVPDLPSALGAATSRELVVYPAVQQALDTEWRRMMINVAADGRPSGRNMMVGALSPVTVSAMEVVGLQPVTAAIGITDAAALQALRQVAAAVSIEQLAALPASLSAPQAVLLDQAANALTYLVSVGATNTELMAIVVGYHLVGTRRANSVRSAALVDLAEIRQLLASGALTLLDGQL